MSTCRALCKLICAGLLTCGLGHLTSVSLADQALITHRPLRLLVDEYHQYTRPDGSSQGFALDKDTWSQTYHYATDATSLVNGLFVLQQLIADDYNLQPTIEPIDADLIDRTEAYMLVCPRPEIHGGLTPEDAEYLESFVAQGGILILVYNSIYGSEQDEFDYKGMNRIAMKFGMELLPTATGTMSIPIERDHPVLYGARGIIYGNGCTIRTHSQPHTEHTVLLESTNPEVPGAVAVKARYHDGAVLVFGDAGSLGNAHMAREDMDHPAAVVQIFRGVLPNGPLPGYGWKSGMRLQVNVRQELAISGAPYGMKLLDLPLHEDTEFVLLSTRDLDLQSAPKAKEQMTPEEIEEAQAHRRVIARAAWDLEMGLEIGEHDGRAFTATWKGPNNSTMTSRITHRGEVLDSSVTGNDLVEWRWAMTQALLPAPLDRAAQIGHTWQAPVNAMLPNTQLHPVPRLHLTEATFRLVGRERVRDRDCLVITRTVLLPLPSLRPQELVNPAYADYFEEQEVRLRNAYHTELTKTWIDAETLLPVRTEMNTSTSLWWTLRDEEDWFLSDHDHRVLEERHETRRVAILGRKLVADFELVSE